MKSKRRHELQTNELADRLGHWIERVRPYGTTILLGIVGVIAICSAGYYLLTTRSRIRSDAWQAYLRAGSDPQVDVASQLGQVADDFGDTSAGVWAAQNAADLEFSRGIRLLFSDRALAETSLNLAKSRYREVLENNVSKTEPMLAVRSHLGLAQTHEALNALSEAKKHYQAVATAAKGTSVGDTAEQRLALVDQAEMKNWSNWFANQKPAPPPTNPSGSSSPLGGALGTPGGTLDALPDLPPADSSLPAGGGVMLDGPKTDANEDASSGSDSADSESDVPSSEKKSADGAGVQGDESTTKKEPTEPAGGSAEQQGPAKKNEPESGTTAGKPAEGSAKPAEGSVKKAEGSAKKADSKGDTTNGKN